MMNQFMQLALSLSVLSNLYCLWCLYKALKRNDNLGFRVIRLESIIDHNIALFWSKHGTGIASALEDTKMGK